MTDKAGDMKDYGFEDIYPYDDAQTREALARISRHPGIWVISKYLFPERPLTFVVGILRSSHQSEPLRAQHAP